jgi:hypothetical protein
MRDKAAMLIKPFPEKLLIGLSNQDAAFIPAKPHILSVGLFVEFPVEGLAIVRMEHHECAWIVTISIEDILAWIFGDVYNPVKVFDCEKGNIHVYPSIPSQDGYTNEV